MNQQALLKKIKKMQDEMVQTQKEIEETVFSATAGGGVVTVDIFGTKEVENIHIAEDFEIESKEDLEMLSDMIVAACKQAYQDIDKTTKQKMEKYQSLLGGFSGLF